MNLISSGGFPPRPPSRGRPTDSTTGLPVPKDDLADATRNQATKHNAQGKRIVRYAP